VREKPYDFVLAQGEVLSLFAWFSIHLEVVFESCQRRMSKQNRCCGGCRNARRQERSESEEDIGVTPVHAIQQLQTAVQINGRKMQLAQERTNHLLSDLILKLVDETKQHRQYGLHPQTGLLRSISSDQSSGRARPATGDWSRYDYEPSTSASDESVRLSEHAMEQHKRRLAYSKKWYNENKNQIAKANRAKREKKLEDRMAKQMAMLPPLYGPEPPPIEFAMGVHGGVDGVVETDSD